MAEFLNANIQMLILVIGCAVLLAIASVYYIDRFKKRASSKNNNQAINLPQSDTVQQPDPIPIEPEEAILGNDNPNALVIDKNRRYYGLRRVKLKQGKNYGGTWDYYGKQVFWVKWDGQQFDPVKPRTDLNNTPHELYEALQVRPYIRLLFDIATNEQNKFKLMAWIVAACVALFLMYLAATN